MASEEYSIQVSDEDSDEDNLIANQQPFEIQGTLSKWTNYIHGWQNRFIVLKEGKLSYYKNEADTIYGCRGSISVHQAIVKSHEIDECRFDVCLNDCAWYLRTTTADDRQRWADAIEQNKEVEGLNRHGSSLSLSQSTTSSSSFKRLKGGLHDLDSGLRDKIAEIDTYRDIVVKQMETLQSYFDDCSKSAKSTDLSCNGLIIDQESDLASTDLRSSSPAPTRGSLPIGVSAETLERHASTALDFRGEALTFKATTAGILTALGQCVEVMNQREEQFKRRMDREVEKRKRLEEKIKVLSQSNKNEHQTTARYLAMGGPDYEEGPHSVIAEDEFYDAVESALDKMDEEEEFRERIRMKQRQSVPQSANQHALWPTIEQYTHQQLQYAREAVEGGVWQLFVEDGEMKMYRRELEEDGLVVDPLKAVHQVLGATAHEMAHHFWSPDVRFEWDTSIEKMTVLDKISKDTLIFLQLHKRVWPTAQRDAVFWSHIRRVQGPDPILSDDPNLHDTWIVCNKTTEHPDAPNDGKCVRVDLLVCIVCQTFIIDTDAKDVEKEGNISRDNLLCKITYCSIVNPGGWAPASVLRAVYKREYPKFLKRFTQYVVDKCHDHPISFSGLKISNHSKHWIG